jgi:hypothetical protein
MAKFSPVFGNRRRECGKSTDACEYCHLLAGRCTIEIEGKAPVHLKTGDVFIVETGAKGKDGARSHAQILRVRARALIGELREIISRA